jgi:hypothetical protein
MSATKFRVEQNPEQEAMTVDDLRQMVNDGDVSKVCGYGKNVLAGTSAVQGSSAYWTARRSDLASMVKHFAFEKGEFPVVFMTGSAAEYHWRDLHACLHQYFLMWNQHAQ